MQCDDSYSSLVEIEFDGAFGKDIRVESDNCPLEGVSNDGWGHETTLHFNGPDRDKAWECTITIEKKQNGKKIRMNYQLHDSC